MPKGYKDRGEIIPHNCLECDEPLIKRDHESIDRYNNKRYCSATHAKIALKREGRGWWSPESKGWRDGAFSKKGLEKSLQSQP